MRKFGVVLVLVFLTIITANAQKRVLDKIVAQVGGSIILQSDVETSYSNYLFQGNPPNALVKCQIAQNLISQKLLTQQAVIDSIEVKDAEVDDEVDRRMRQSIQRAGGEDKLEQFLHKPVIQYKDEIRPDVREMLISERMRAKITDKLNTTPADVKKYFSTFPKDSLPMVSKEVQVGAIVISPKLTKEEKDYSREKIEELYKRIKANPDDFPKLAAAYSQDPGSASEGGDVGWGDRSGYAKEYSANAFKLKAGEISPVFESEFGYHFLQVIERRGEQVHTRHILITPKITTQSLVRAKVTADSIYNVVIKNLTDGTFSNAAGVFSDDKETKYTGGMIMNPENVQTRTTLIPTDKLDPQIALVIDTMKVGELSKPVLFTDASGKQSYRMFYLKSVTNAHRANLDQDFPKLRVAANEDKINRTISEWFEKKRKQTFIRIDKEYQSCPVISDWSTPSTIQAKL